MNFTTNKYGQDIALPNRSDTALERAVESVLVEIGADYIKQYAFNETGLRSSKFDFAVIHDKEIRLLIECDGAPHFNKAFFVNCGRRECRAKPGLIKVHLADAAKTRIANDHGIPLLRINPLYQNDDIRDYILSYLWEFCDRSSEKNKEISMVKMLDRYGWDFEYVQPSKPSKAEAKFLADRGI